MSISFRNPETTPIVFDVDGTLLDSNGCFWDGKKELARVIQTQRPDLTDEVLGVRIRAFAHEFQAANGASHHIFARLLLAGYDTLRVEYGMQERPEDRGCVLEAGAQVIAWECPPFPGVMEMLKALRDAGYPLGLCTKGADIEFQAAKLDRWGLRDMVDVSSVVAQKGPQDFEAVLRQLNSGNLAGIVAGDSLKEDVGSGRVLGIESAWVRTRDHPWLHELPVSAEESGATWVVENITELPNIAGLKPRVIRSRPKATRSR